MATETIELLHNYKPSRMVWPALHQQKVDGVPVIITNTPSGAFAYTRQNTLVTVIPHILKECHDVLGEWDIVVMELHIEGMKFKEISGHVRKKVPDQFTDLLYGHVFDYIPPTMIRHPYAERREFYIRNITDTVTFQLSKSQLVMNDQEAMAAHAALMAENPLAEGSVLHSASKVWSPGKRCWGTQRIKHVPTIDLLVIGFVEAVSENGVPKSMVGGIKAELTTQSGKTVIGIGPGALTHKERKSLWKMWQEGTYVPCIAEIKYMDDPSYKSLRQPTFKCWRSDKIVPDIYSP